MKKRLFGIFFLSSYVLFSLYGSTWVWADRIKELAFVRGVRENELVGYGLVVGLHNTGDDFNALFTLQSVTTMLKRLGIQSDSSRLRLRNVAAVMVTTRLPAFAKIGTKLDVVVSSLATATSLQGGTLVETQLKGADGQVYALAQGPLTVGGYDFSGKMGTAALKNLVNAGRIPAGAMVEKEISSDALLNQKELTLALHTPDFTTATRVANEINKSLGDDTARVSDPSSLLIKVPDEYKTTQASLIAKIESLEVEPDKIARVIINERTGTVVAGADVKLSPAAVAHGSLIVEVKEYNDATQPAPFSNGTTQNIQNSQVDVREGKNKMHYLEGGTSLSDVVTALNGIGATPRDLMAILQALKKVGALNAEVEIQ